MKSHAAFVIRDNDKVLFVQRAATKKSLPNIWAFPSGTIEEGESPAQTAVREAKEELSLDVNAERVLAIADLHELGAQIHFVVCTLAAPNQQLVADPNEIQATRWMTMADFLATHTDDQIGHGLVWLRTRPELWA